MMHRVNVAFDKKQINRLLKGHTVQVSASQLQKSSTTPILLTNKQFSVYKRSLKLNKGMRFHIDPSLMNDNHMILGEGIKDVFKSIKKTAKSVSKAVMDRAIKPTGRQLKESAKSAGKQFAMDALASDNIRGYAKDNAKRRALEWAKDDALNIARAGVSNSIAIGERELEDALIENHGFPEDLARQVVSAGSHNLSRKAYDELMNVDEALNQELINVAEGAGIPYRITKGGRLSFKGFLRGVKRVGQKILKVARPVLKPIVQLGAQTVGTMVGGPVGAKIGEIVGDKGYDMLAGSGMRKRGRPRHGAGAKKGSAEMKARMARVRASKRTGGALRPAGHGYGRGLSPAGYY
jgi:hypothetical protein